MTTRTSAGLLRGRHEGGKVASIAGVLATLLVIAGALAMPAVAVTSNVGQHIHVEIANHPVDGFPIARGDYTFHVTIRRHDFPAPIRYIRLDDNSTTRAKITFSPALPPCTDCATTFNWTINFASWSVGRHEFRWHADSQDADPNRADTQRQYTTTRLQVCIVVCSPTYRSQRYFIGGGSWYTGPGYVVPLITSPDTAIKPGGTYTQRSQYQSHVCSYLNPNFHQGNPGQKLGCGSTVTIPLTATPGDKLVVVADVPQEAGVLELRVGDGTPRPTMFVATQTWWAQGGLVIP